MMLTLIDPKAGTHFNRDKIVITQHARERAIQRLHLKDNVVTQSLCDRLSKAALVDEDFIAEDGQVCRLFVHSGVCILVAKDSPTIITVFRPLTDSNVKSPFMRMANRMIKSAKRAEASELKQLSRERASVNLRIAQLEYDTVHEKRQAAKRKLTEQVAELKTELERIDNEIFTVRRAKATILRSVCAYVV